MKKNFVLICIIAILLLAGCSKQESENQKPLESLTYSNLTDKVSQEEVRQALVDAGISADAIGEFFFNVNEFNNMIENETLTKEGFETIDTLEPEYDVVTMQELLEKKSPDFIGYNCRITSLGLMKEFIQIDNSIIEDESSLAFDLYAFESKPDIFTQEEQKTFKSLFSHIPIEKTADTNKYLDVVKQNWETKGIHFKNTEKATVISVFFYLDDGMNQPTVFIGHMGVLLYTNDGKLLFLEKLSFQEPYQAIKFQNKIELNDYLMNKYDIEWGEEATHPIIMENGELLQGYRLNPYKKS